MPILPDINEATFEPGAAIDNPFLPYTPGHITRFGGSTIDEDSGEVTSENNDEFVTFESKSILGVETLVVRDTAYEDGVLVEDTLDYYAQASDGTVWYFGELSINYEYDDDGNYEETNTDGSFEAGVDGAQAGWIMRANPAFGNGYYQEFLPGEAVDEAIVAGLQQQISIGLGDFEGVLQTLESTVLEPDFAEFKYYAPEVGLILVEEGLDGEGEPEFVVERLFDRIVDHSEDGPGGLVRDRDFSLSDLRNTQPLDGVELVNEPEANEFVGDGSDFIVTFLNEDAGFDNSIGAYLINAQTGEIGEGRILFAATDDLDAGASAAVEVAEGWALGLFAVADGADLGIDLEEFEDGGLFFRNFLTGEAATIEDGLAPLVTDGEGTPLPIQALHAIGNQNGFNFLNPVAGVQAVELESQIFNDDGPIPFELLGFEDLQATDPRFDADYNDVVIAVSEAPLPEFMVTGFVGELLAGEDTLLG